MTATNDKARQARERELQQEREERLQQAWAWLMADERGRLLAYHIVFERCALQSSSYAASGQEMAMREGRRAVGIDIGNDLQALAPEGWIQMLQERFSRAVLEQLALRATPKDRSTTR